MTEVLLGYGYRLARVLAYLFGVLSVLMAFVLGSPGGLAQALDLSPTNPGDSRSW